MSTVTLWSRRDPFAGFDTAFNRAVRESFAPRPTRTVRAAQPAGFVPAADQGRDGDDAVVRLELPGLDVDNDVTVEVDGGRLIVRGERRSDTASDATGASWREVRYGSFRRTFTLPAHVTGDSVSAGYDAGVLTVRVTGAYAAPSTAYRVAVTTAVAAVTPGPSDATSSDGEQTSDEQPQG